MFFSICLFYIIDDRNDNVTKINRECLRKIKFISTQYFSTYLYSLRFRRILQFSINHAKSDNSMVGKC